MQHGDRVGHAAAVGRAVPGISHARIGARPSRERFTRPPCRRRAGRPPPATRARARATRVAARRGFPAAAAAAGFRACAQGADRGTKNVEPYRIHNRIQPQKSNPNSTNAQTVALPLACPLATGSWSSSQSWRRPQPAWASPGMRLVGAAAASRGAETFVSSPTARQSAIANPLADGRPRGMNACPARISLCYSRLERDSASPLQSCPGN